MHASHLSQSLGDRRLPLSDDNYNLPLLSIIPQYQKLSALVEDFPREEILEAMFCCKGDTVAAQARLVQAKLEPFANRIWQQQSQTPNTLGSSAVVSAAAITTTSGFTLQGMISNLAGAFAASALSGTVPGRNDAVGREGTGNATGNNAGPVDPYQGFAASIIGHQQFQDMIRDKSVDSEVSRLLFLSLSLSFTAT